MSVSEEAKKKLKIGEVTFFFDKNNNVDAEFDEKQLNYKFSMLELKEIITFINENKKEPLLTTLEKIDIIVDGVKIDLSVD